MLQARPFALISDDELLRRLAELLRQSRRVESDLVAHIGEVDKRQLYAREASPSMFAYCTEVLHLSEAEAYLRITVARASREHPVLLAMLADGRLHLTGIAKLAPHLTLENRAVLLARATHGSKRQIEELLAELAPRPDAPALMRKLPEGNVIRTVPEANVPAAPARAGAAVLPPRVQVPGPGAATADLLRPDGVARAAVELGQDGVAAAAQKPGPDRVATAALELGPDGVAGVAADVPSTTPVDPDPGGVVGPAVAATLGPESSPSTPVRRLQPATMRFQPATVQPLAPARYRVQFTASAELHDKLERLRALLRSQVPDGDLGAVIERAVCETLERLEARRFARTRRPRKSLAESNTSPTSRHIPAAVRRAVRERDGNRCGYVDEKGRRCSERERLEYHHRHPFGLGGDHSPGNIRLMCAAHNAYLADHDYGRQEMARRRRSGKQPWTAAGGQASERAIAPVRAGPP